MIRNSVIGAELLGVLLLWSGSGSGPAAGGAEVSKEPAPTEAPEYFLLRPEVEKAYGYTHAIRIGDDIKISGAVSMDDEGTPTAVGDLEQQMKNAYADLERVLEHYGCTFDDVVVENVFTTDMAQCAAEALAEYMRRHLGAQARPGIVVSITTSGDLIQWHPHGHVIRKLMR